MLYDFLMKLVVGPRQFLFSLSCVCVCLFVSFRLIFCVYFENSSEYKWKYHSKRFCMDLLFFVIRFEWWLQLSRHVLWCKCCMSLRNGWWLNCWWCCCRRIGIRYLIKNLYFILFKMNFIIQFQLKFKTKIHLLHFLKKNVAKNIS